MPNGNGNGEDRPRDMRGLNEAQYDMLLEIKEAIFEGDSKVLQAVNDLKYDFGQRITALEQRDDLEDQGESRAETRKSRYGVWVGIAASVALGLANIFRPPHL